MLTVGNAAKERLEAGELALGIGVRMSRTVDIAKAMKTCGCDWLFIDMEHSSMDLDTAAQISVASQSAGITPIVRVPGFEHHHASRVLDAGTMPDPAAAGPAHPNPGPHPARMSLALTPCQPASRSLQ